MAVNRIFGAIAQSGGATGALDRISSTALADKDMAVVTDDTLGSINFYTYDGASVLTESLPTVITPDDIGGGAGRWVLISPYYFVENLVIQAGSNILTNELYGNGADLDIGYQDGTVDISIGTSTITITKDIITDSVIISTLPDGTAPITTVSNTLCTGLNAEFIGDEPITNISLLDNNTNKYSVLPQVTNSVTIVPTVDADLATKVYVDDAVGVIDTSLYSLVDGTRAFTGVVIGVYPTLASHLSTKSYVDDNIITDHGGLTGKGDDDHTQYTLADGTRAFTAVVTGVYPISDLHLSTKNYVDDNVAGLTSVHSGLLGLDADDHIQYMLGNGIRSFVQEVGGIDPYDPEHLSTKFYTDYVADRFMLSSTDEFYDYFDNKIETNDAFSTTNIYDGTDTGVIVEKTTELAGAIGSTTVTQGGTTQKFFVYDPTDAGYPQTFLDVTNGGIFDDTGTSGTDLTETQLYPPSDTNSPAGDADIRVREVVGDIEYMEIIDGGTGLTGVDAWYLFPINGDGTGVATWEAQIVSNTIVAVRRDTTAINSGVGIDYSFADDVIFINGISGDFTLRPYITGAVGGFNIVSNGDGYTSATYNLSEATKASFTISGFGTTTTLGDLDVAFINPISEKLKLSHFISTTTPGTLYASGYSRSAGTAISAINFNEWGHITQISEQGVGSVPWVKWTTGDLSFGTRYFVDTTGGTVTLDMSASPSIGDEVVIDDYQKNSSINNITVRANGGGTLRVEGVDSNLIVDVDEARVLFIFVDGTYGWRYKVF